MAQNKPIYSVTPKNYKANSGNAALINEPVIGIVKNNVDPSRSGRIQVFVANVGSENPDDSDSWLTVSYLSPFYGVSTPQNDIDTEETTSDYGKSGIPQNVRRGHTSSLLDHTKFIIVYKQCICTRHT